MNRRDAIKRSFLVLGSTAVSTSVLSGLLAGCKSDATVTFATQFFDETEAKSLSRILDILIPTTDTPGALDAGVLEFLDRFAADYLPEADQQKLRDGMAAINTDSEARFGKAFAAASAKQQVELIEAYDQAAFGNTGQKDTFAAKDFYQQIKENACWAYCTSERGANEHLQFVLIPGGYTNCIPLEEAGDGVTFVYP
ncbi:MAG: gluconate 2-dehydrogenase subunit 3 family protein [Bacteroidota bacterium]